MKTLDTRIYGILSDVQFAVADLSVNPLLQYNSDSNFLNADSKTFEYNINDEEQSIINLLKSYKDHHPFVNSVYYGTVNGAFIRSQFRAVSTKYDPRERIWYKLATSSPGEILRTEAYPSLTTTDVNIGTVTTVIDPNGKLLGVIGMDVTLHKLTEITGDFDHSKSSYTVIVSKEGLILAHPDTSLLFTSANQLSYYYNRNEKNNSYPMNITENNIEKAVFLYTSPDTNWSYFQIVPIHIIEAPLRRLNLLMLFIFIILVLSIIFSSIIFSTYFSKRIHKISNALNKAKSGDLTVYIEDEGNDELSTISKQLNKLISQIFEQQYNARYIDEHTHLINRHKLIEIMDQSKDSPFTLIGINIENLILINTLYGHGLGDRLIEIFAERLREFSSESATISRLSTSLFCIIMYNELIQESVTVIVDRLLLKLSQVYQLSDYEIFLDIRIGVILPNISKIPYEELLINLALTTFHHDPRNGNNCEFFSEALRNNSLMNLTIEKEIPSSLMKNEFYAVFQPVFNLETKEIGGFEALARWNHPTLGSIYPDQFIPIMEKNKTILDLGEQILEEALSFGIAYYNRYNRRVKIAVNLSIVQISQNGFINLVQKKLSSHNFKAEDLVFEITETVFYKSNESILKVLESLRNLGVHLALDDFGSGYSSINNLLSLPVQYLKIDKNLFSNSLGDAKGKTLINLVMEFAKKVNIDVVIEGVENQDMENAAINYSARYVQGYLYGRPKPFHEFL